MYQYPSYNNYPQYQPYQQPIQQPMQQPQIQQQVQQTIPQQILVWVQSEDEATKYPLQAGQSLFLMNQNDSYLYMKSVDQLGKPTFIKKRLVDETDNTDKVDMSEYIRREEVDNLISDKIQKEVEKRMSQISFKPTRKKVVEEEE